MSDPHADHGDATLSLATVNDDGSHVYQSWTICDCTLPALRARLGEPQQETVADADTVRATGAAVLGVPGAVHRGNGL